MTQPTNQLDFTYTKLFNTIALPGKRMHRGENKKLIDNKPLVLPKWKASHHQHYKPANVQTTAPILASIVDNNLIFIDFDVAEWYEEALAINEKQQHKCGYIAESNKTTADGHFGYYLSEHLVRTTLEITDTDTQQLDTSHYKKAGQKLFGGFGISGKIDIQYGGGKLIFLASTGNETKTLITPPLTSLEGLTPLPSEMLRFVQSLLYQHGKKQNTLIEYKPDEAGLYGIVTQAFTTSDDEIDDTAFFKATTPHKWKASLDKSLHPSSLEEKPHLYLFAYATKLGSDASIDRKTFIAAITKLNSLCNPPKDYNDLNNQIIEPIVSGASRINNEPIWKYNPNWKGSTIAIADRITNDAISIYHDKNSSKDPYIFINLTKETLQRRSLAGATQLFSSLTGVKKPTIQTAKPITLAYTPSAPYGLSTTLNGIEYNEFKRSIPALVAADATEYNKHQTPEDFVRFLSTLFSSDEKRVYACRWMLTKMLTYQHSPVVWMLDGKARAGKGIFTFVMANLMGALDNIDIKTTLVEDLVGDKFNVYLTKAEIVLIDEFASFEPKNKKKATGLTKTISGGGGYYQGRDMQATAKVMETRATFVYNTNEAVRLFDETGQTRLFYNLSREKFFDNFTPEQASYWSQSREFVIQLAAYLGREFESLPMREYMDVPDWVYLNDPDILAYQNSNIKPEKAIEEAFYQRDATQLMAALGISNWEDVPHIADIQKNHRTGEEIKRSRIILQTVGAPGAELYGNSIEELLGNRANWKEIMKNLKRQPNGIAPIHRNHAWIVTFDQEPLLTEGIKQIDKEIL